ncbi:hypothetical protein [Planctomyces sp. SH-PL14]|uniref:hypothetical protein n=1 Tax=Planctomyces sp. SH-PL14 TaxID=1632864 RepID=UPI00078BE0D6|nr:hypothetical protein [Planctomyces sp. SH-PL14]AMV19206.1 hypothetical protein VT03_15050 [Planctomyces sp. SH-PL14]
MLTSRDWAVLRAALMFFDEEMSPHGAEAYRPYLPKRLRPELASAEVADLRHRLSAARVRFLCCDSTATQAVSTRLFRQLSQAEAIATAAGGQVATILVFLD